MTHLDEEILEKREQKEKRNLYDIGKGNIFGWENRSF